MLSSLGWAVMAASVAVLIAVVARRRGVGIAIPLLAAGILLGVVPGSPGLPDEPEAILILLLAPLVFGEAISLAYLDLRRVRRPVLLLAVGLVVVGAFAIGMAASAVVPGMSLAVGLTLGAVLGPTDAVSVSLTAKRAGLPHRLVSILEGESLVNDGTALTMLRVAVVAAASGGVTAVQAGGILLESVVGGCVVGAAGGLWMRWMLRRGHDPIASNGLVMVIPFPLYLLAERIGGSGILSVVVAGLIISHTVVSEGGFRLRLHSGASWSQLTFLLQAVAFLFIGLEVPETLGDLTDSEVANLLRVLPVVFAVMILARFLFVLMMVLVDRVSDRAQIADEIGAGRTWIVAGWAGARGPISGLAAFSIPLTTVDGSPFPHRNLIIATSLCVVVATLVLAPTLTVVTRWIGVRPDDAERQRSEIRLVLARCARQRGREVVRNAEEAGEPLPPPVVEEVLAQADRRVHEARLAVRAQVQETPTVIEALQVVDAGDTLRWEMLTAEEEELRRQRDTGQITEAMMRSLQRELDVRKAHRDET